METNLPAQWVRVGHGIPTVCSRHGRPATRRVTTQFASRLSPWMYLLIAVSFLIYAIVTWATRKTVVAKGWPFCSRCRIVRVLQFSTRAAVSAAGIVGILVVEPPGSTRTQLSLTEGLVLVAGLILFLAGIIAMTRSGWASVARAAVTRDGVWVSVRRAHPRFDAQVLAATGPPYSAVPARF
jgi:hypothetical protein